LDGGLTLDLRRRLDLRIAYIVVVAVAVAVATGRILSAANRAKNALDDVTGAVRAGFLGRWLRGLLGKRLGRLLLMEACRAGELVD
jgi:hypothetical protein